MNALSSIDNGFKVTALASFLVVFCGAAAGALVVDFDRGINIAAVAEHIRTEELPLPRVGVRDTTQPWQRAALMLQDSLAEMAKSLGMKRPFIESLPRYFKNVREAWPHHDNNGLVAGFERLMAAYDKRYHDDARFIQAVQYDEVAVKEMALRYADETPKAFLDELDRSSTRRHGP